ncbi:class I adenylate-forming enzyme family protein [Krasilnikovia sp. M28-CT-15]|uniref:class I adenylate-forming enzyme family protein n=1 Tax=Krasilnikovia sp. M28-CT-15 TaxID=3373540 RepID=UPI003875FDD4
MTNHWSDGLIDSPSDATPAVLFPGGALTYQALRRSVRDWEKRLRETKVGERDAVAIQVPPSVTYLSLLLAVLRLGCQAQLLDHRLTLDERRRYLHDLRPAVTVTTDGRAAVTGFQAVREARLLTAEQPAPSTPHAIVQFSSGSTGDPKVIGRHSTALEAELARFAAVPGWVGKGDVLLVLNSLVHSFGLIGAVLHGLSVGATLAFAATSLPRDLKVALAEFKPTLVSGVPAQFDLMARLPAGSLGEVRACVSGGEVMSAGTYERFSSQHGLVPGQSYGLTEVGVVAMDVTGAESPAVGRVVDGQEVQIVEGEVVVPVPESPYLTSVGSERVRDGRLHTGDRGTLSDAVLQIHGRTDSLIVIGGLKVELSEVEAVLRRAPGVDEILVLPHGDSIEAHVGSHSGVTAESLYAWCAQHLADYKRPRTIVVGPSLPRTVTGKLLRRPHLLDARNRDVAP